MTNKPEEGGRREEVTKIIPLEELNGKSSVVLLTAI